MGLTRSYAALCALLVLYACAACAAVGTRSVVLEVKGRRAVPGTGSHKSLGGGVALTHSFAAVGAPAAFSGLEDNIGGVIVFARDGQQDARLAKANSWEQVAFLRRQGGPRDGGLGRAVAVCEREADDAVVLAGAPVGNRVYLWSQKHEWRSNPFRGTLDNPFEDGAHFGSALAASCDGEREGDGLVRGRCAGGLSVCCC